MTALTPVLEAALDLGEGPVWDAQRQALLCVDIMLGQVHTVHPESGRHRVYEIGVPVGAIACTTAGDWILAAQRGFARLDPESGRVTPLREAAPGRDDLRMNDGYVDPWGRFWAGTLSLRREPLRAALYRLDADGTVHTVLEPVTTSNGIDWAPDRRTMYYVDTATGRVDQCDVDPDHGTIAARRPFVSIDPNDGRPDGLIVDAAGGVWVALWRGGALRRYRPDGTLDLTIAVPATNVTKCAFGGADLGDLYITTARSGLTQEQLAAEPLAGQLFRVRPGFQGQAPRRFLG